MSVKTSYIPWIYPPPSSSNLLDSWNYLFRFRNPELNFYLPLASWVGGRSNIYIYTPFWGSCAIHRFLPFSARFNEAWRGFALLTFVWPLLLFGLVKPILFHGPETETGKIGLGRKNKNWANMWHGQSGRYIYIYIAYNIWYYIIYTVIYKLDFSLFWEDSHAK